MKYAIIAIILLIIIFVLIIIYLKKASTKANGSITNNANKDSSSYEENPNSEFTFNLVNTKKFQFNIYKSKKGESISITQTKDKKINIYNEYKRQIGNISSKDLKKFPLLLNKTKRFQGAIKEIKAEGMGLFNVEIGIKIKKEYSLEIYKLDKQYSSFISLKALFKEEQIIETNYGEAKILKIFDNHLLVEVPSLGEREIYDLTSIIF